MEWVQAEIPALNHQDRLCYRHNMINKDLYSMHRISESDSTILILNFYC